MKTIVKITAHPIVEGWWNVTCSTDGDSRVITSKGYDHEPTAADIKETKRKHKYPEPKDNWHVHTNQVVRMKICPKTIRFESFDAEVGWKYYDTLKLPITPEHAASLVTKYQLTEPQKRSMM